LTGHDQRPPQIVLQAFLIGLVTLTPPAREAFAKIELKQRTKVIQAVTKEILRTMEMQHSKFLNYLVTLTRRSSVGKKMLCLIQTVLKMTLDGLVGRPPQCPCRSTFAGPSLYPPRKNLTN